MFVISKATGELANKRDEILKATEEFFGEIYHFFSDVQPKFKKEQ